MIDFTIYTPTYNRAHTLPRLYDSLKNQSYKNFIWLIVDDGSTDKTRSLVDTWINEAILEIKYLYKPNGGKHTAMELAHQSVTTKYVIEFDSDDVLLPKAIETFHFNWKLIEEQGLEGKIAEVRAFLTRDLDSNIIGGDIAMFKKGTDYIDSNWHEWVLKKNYRHEMISALNTAKLNECVSISKYKYMANNIKFISEGIFWSSLGRKYKTRYIKHILGKVYYDSQGSLLRPKEKNADRFCNHLVGTFYIVDENMKYFWMNPLFFLRNIFIFLISGFYIREKFSNQLKMITNIYFFCLFIIFYPFAFIIYCYMRFIIRLR